MTREDIIKYADTLYSERFIRFIMSYKLNAKELEYFYNKFKNNINVCNHLNYYQEKNIYAFYHLLWAMLLNSLINFALCLIGRNGKFNDQIYSNGENILCVEIAYETMKDFIKEDNQFDFKLIVVKSYYK